MASGRDEIVVASPASIILGYETEDGSREDLKP